MRRVKQLVFSWRRGATSGELPYVSRFKRVSGAKGLPQMTFEHLGLTFSHGPDFIHPANIVALEDVASCPLGTSIRERASKGSIMISDIQIGVLPVSLCAIFNRVGRWHQNGELRRNWGMALQCGGQNAHIWLMQFFTSTLWAGWSERARIQSWCEFILFEKLATSQTSSW